jgi:hypothetical protein
MQRQIQFSAFTNMTPIMRDRDIILTRLLAGQQNLFNKGGKRTVV